MINKIILCRSLPDDLKLMREILNNNLQKRNNTNNSSDNKR